MKSQMDRCMHDDASKIYVEKLETVVFHLDAFIDSPFLVNVAVNLSHLTKIDELTRIQAGRPGGASWGKRSSPTCVWHQKSTPSTEEHQFAFELIKVDGMTLNMIFDVTFVSMSCNLFSFGWLYVEHQLREAYSITDGTIQIREVESFGQRLVVTSVISCM